MAGPVPSDCRPPASRLQDDVADLFLCLIPINGATFVPFRSPFGASLRCAHIVLARPTVLLSKAIMSFPAICEG